MVIHVPPLGILVLGHQHATIHRLFQQEFSKPRRNPGLGNSLKLCK